MTTEERADKLSSDQFIAEEMRGWFREEIAARRFINVGLRAKGSRRYFHFREIK